MRLTAQRGFRYKGRSLKAGEVFEASTLDGKAYKAIRYATDAPVNLPKPAPKHEPKHEPKHAQETAAAEAAPGPEEHGRYGTRRLKADD